MFPLKSLTRWWELGCLPTNRRGTRKGKTLQRQAYLSCTAGFLAFPSLLHRKTKGHSAGVSGKFRTNEWFSQDGHLTCWIHLLRKSRNQTFCRTLKGTVWFHVQEHLKPLGLSLLLGVMTDYLAAWEKPGQKAELCLQWVKLRSRWDCHSYLPLENLLSFRNQIWCIILN